MVWKIKQTQEEKSSKGRRKERKKGERQTHTFLKTLNYSNPKLFFLSKERRGKKKTRKTFGSRPKLTRVLINTISSKAQTGSTCFI